MAEAEKVDAKMIRERRIQQQTSSEEEIVRIVTAAYGSPPVRTERITVDFSWEVHRMERYGTAD